MGTPIPEMDESDEPISLVLVYRPPFSYEPLIRFLRARGIGGVARMIADGTLSLVPGGDPEQTMARLQSIRGIGPWTAQYAAMRALGWQDAFPKEDYGIKQAFPSLKPKQIEMLSQAWRPYRSYAVMSLWQAPHE